MISVSQIGPTRFHSPNQREPEKSQIRHSSYCRKRAKNPPKPRKRSCLSCTRAKTSCSADLPACSRCCRKGIACEYQDSRSAVKPPARLVRPVPEKALSPSIDNSSSLEPFADPFPLTFSDISSDGAGLVDGTSSSLTGAFNGSVDYFPQYPHISDGLPESSILSYEVFAGNEIALSPIHSTKSQPEVMFLLDSTKSMPNPNSRIFDPLGSAPSLRVPRAFKPRTIRNWRLSLLRRFVLANINAYPAAMLPGKGFPPFIHAQCPVGESHKYTDPKSIPRPLTTCSGIVAMWSMKNESNVSFIWNSIRGEHERLAEEVCNAECSKDPF